MESERQQTGRPGAAVGLTDVRRVHEARDAFGQMDQQFGAGLVRPVVVKYLTTTVFPLLHGRYDDTIGSKLMTAAAEMTEMAGWTAFDLGRHGVAQQHFGQALRLTRTAGDLLTGAYVLMTMTRQAIYLGETKWAIRLAGAADSARRAGAPPRVMAFILVKQAGALALQWKNADIRNKDDLARAERLLPEAEHLHAEAPTDRDPAWLTSYGDPGFAAALGACWNLTGNKAVTYTETAARGYGTCHSRAIGFTQVNAAEAYLGMKEVEQALDTAKAVVPVAKALTSVRLVKRLREFNGALEPYGGTTLVREFREHLKHELAA